MKKIIIILSIILIGASGVTFFNSRSMVNRFSEQQATEIAIQAVVNDGRENWLKAECVSAIISEKDPSVINFDLHEVHNASCGGNPDTSPRITSVIVNLKTGEVFDQSTQMDVVDEGLRAVTIDGKEYRVAKQLR